LLRKSMESSIPGTIDSNGFVHFLAFADASNGTTASRIETDYVELEVELSVSSIGDKSTLKTSHKSTLVGAINEAFQSASDGKTAVANAITAKGVTASPSDTFPTLATKIGQISTGKKW